MLNPRYLFTFYASDCIEEWKRSYQIVTFKLNRNIKKRGLDQNSCTVLYVCKCMNLQPTHTIYCHLKKKYRQKRVGEMQLFQSDATESFIQLAVCLTCLQNPFYSITQTYYVELVGKMQLRSCLGINWKLFRMELRKMKNTCTFLFSHGQDVITSKCHLWKKSPKFTW